MPRIQGAKALHPKERTSATEEKISEVVKLISKYGASVRAACAEAGLPYGTLKEARNTNELIEELLGEARSKFQFTAEKTVAEYVRGELDERERLKAAQWWLGKRARWLYGDEITVKDKPVNAWIETLSKAREQVETNETDSE